MRYWPRVPDIDLRCTQPDCFFGQKKLAQYVMKANANTNGPNRSTFLKAVDCLRITDGATLHDHPDRYARRIFGAWSGLLGILVQTYFVVFNTVTRGLYPEDVYDMFSVVLLLVALMLLCMFGKEKAAFRLGIATSMFVATYTVALNSAHQESALLLFFVVPASLFFLLGFKESLLWLAVLLPGFTVFCVTPEQFGAPPIPASVVLRLLSSLYVFSGYAALVQYLGERSLFELHQANDALQNATIELKQIGGLVPVCSYCRKILDEKGYWRQLEAFLKQNTNACISSGLCEKCAAQLGQTGESEAFTVPKSLQSLFQWKSTLDNMRRQFVVYAGLVGSALIWGFIIRDFSHGEPMKAWMQIIVSVLLMITVGYQLRTSHSRLTSVMLLTALFFLLVQPFFLTAPEVSEMFWFYLYPLVAAFLLGRRLALLTILALFTFSLGVMFFPHRFMLRDVSAFTRMFFLLTFVLVAVLSINMERMRALYNRILMERLTKLAQTFDSIRTIKGLVPVCRNCKSIRTDEGFWTSFDSYFRVHTDVVFSHGICEACLKREAPEVYEEMIAEKP